MGAPRTFSPKRLVGIPEAGSFSKTFSTRKWLASSMLMFNFAEVSNHPTNPCRSQNQFSASLLSGTKQNKTTRKRKQDEKASFFVSFYLTNKSAAARTFEGMNAILRTGVNKKNLKHLETKKETECNNRQRFPAREGGEKR